MKSLDGLKRFVQFDTAGWIAVSALLLCGISGVMLAIPYDFNHAFRSVFELVVLNPVGSFVRNLHYWSAQLFFISALLHILDHLLKSTESKIKSTRTWLLLCLILLVLGYEMLSGFILKGDAAGVQARRVFESLLLSIPFAGKMLVYSFAGSEENWMVVYVQHISAGTLILFIGVYEHLRSLRPRRSTFMLVTIILTLLAVIFRAPLGLEESSQLKGPWFFVTIQEMLHQISRPWIIVFIFSLFLLTFTCLRWLSPAFRRVLKRGFLLMGILYLVITIVALLFRGENWQWNGVGEESFLKERLLIPDPLKPVPESTVTVWPENQKAEGCLLCHSAMTGLSASHNPVTVGCYACHLGDPFSANKKVAHRNMVKVPGDFSNVRQTCGTQSCHPEVVSRMMKSLMTTQSGIVGVDKFVFGESTTPDDTFHIKNLGSSAADTHLRNLCAGCHLGKEKLVTGNAAWNERGGGCNGCHLHYNNQATESMKWMQSGSLEKRREVHPAIDVAVSNDRCRSCHSRSGRISLNYEGWNETSLRPEAISDTNHFKLLPDDRVLNFVQSDIHHQKGMACIDCHLSYELMGDGSSPVHKEEAVKIQCVDCHPVATPTTVRISELPDRESQMVAWLRKYNVQGRVILTQKGKLPLLNTKVDSLDRLVLTDKLYGKTHLSKPVSSACTKGKGHERLSCEACHTAWVPQCIGCHNAFEKETSGFDLLEGKQIKGTWVEYAGKSFGEPPVLGVSEAAGSKIVTATPGMILTIDHQSFSPGAATGFHRLYAPASGHTTQREGRSCKSCHNDPLAIGFGRGDLRFEISNGKGRWKFEPRFTSNTSDGLPEDAWTGFLREAIPPYSTRSTLRPFNVNEQKRILEVGSCLTCHNEKSGVMTATLENYPQSLARRKIQCTKTQ